MARVSLLLVTGLLLLVVPTGSLALDRVTTPSAASPRATMAANGLEVAVPSGWHGRLRRGLLTLATIPLPAVDTRAPGLSRRLGRRGVLLRLEEWGVDPTTGRLPPVARLQGPLRIGAGNLVSLRTRRDWRVPPGHAFAVRFFALRGRAFALRVEFGSDPPAAASLAAANRVLATLRVAPGDRYAGTLPPPSFAPAPGWWSGSDGPGLSVVNGEQAAGWASTVPWRDERWALPRNTLRTLPADGIVIRVFLSAGYASWPPYVRLPGRPFVRPPFRLETFEGPLSWEGQVRDIPDFVLVGRVYGAYDVDLHVYFGRARPTAAMWRSAQAALDRLRLPVWPRWEL